MDITVKLHGVLQKDRFKQAQLSMPDGSLVQVVIDRLELPPELLDIILINGVHAQVDETLHEGDTLSLLPLLEGG